MLGDYEEPIDNEPRDAAASSAKPRPVPGVPGVQRVGNSYGAAPNAKPGLGAAGTMPPVESRSTARTVDVPGAELASRGIDRARSTLDAAQSGATPSQSGVNRFPGAFEVGTSGQPSLVSKKIVEPIRGFFADSAVAARGEGEYNALRAERGITVRPPVSDTYPDETRRGAAAGSMAAHAANGITISPFSAADLTQQQRNTAGDAYRASWQREASGGLRNAGASGVDLYNAEQQVRGTGITARRGANGVMEFSGDGANALPQNYTQGVDLNAANASMARANAIRQSYLDSQAGSDGGPRGGVISDNSADETNARFARSRLLEQIGRAGRSQAAALAQIANADATNARSSADLASRDRNADADRGLRQQQFAQRSGMEMARLGIDQQRVGAEVEGRRLQNRAAQRLEDLQLQYEQASPADRPAIAEQIRLRSGRAEQKPQNAQVIYNEELINPAQPTDGTRRVPMILNRDGTATVVTPRKELPSGVSRDAAIQSARRALESGYDREAVLARLGEYGLTIEDITR